MDLKKLARVIRVRKWFVIGAALVGAVIGSQIALSMNQGRQPEFEATAIVQFGSQGDERNRDPAAEDELANALVAAEAANQAVIDRGEGRVSSNGQSGELLFSARAREESVAAARAESMRSAYLESTTEGSTEDRQQRLTEIVTEASGILAQLEELNPSPAETEEPESEIDPDVSARLDLLDALVTGLTQQHTKLEVDLILARAGDERVGDPEEIQAELDGVSARLDEIYAEIAEISAENDLSSSQVTGRQDQNRDQGEVTAETSADPRTAEMPSGAQSPEEIENLWTTEALQSRYEELAVEYESLFIENRAAAPAELAAPQITDLTPARAGARMYAGAGLVLGALLVAALAMGEAVLSRRVFVLSDGAPLNGLAEIPAARALMAGRPGWRVASASPRRVDGIHRLRIALLAIMDSAARTPAVALTPVGVDHDETGMLATDLARRLAASGRSVLVLDVDFGTDPPYPVAASSTSVADLISRARVDPEGAATHMKEAFAEVTSTEPYRLIRSGTLNEDPADALLTDAFHMLLEVAREQSDVVLIVGTEAAHASTFSLQQSLDGLIAVCAVGRTRWNTLLELAQPESGVVPAQGMVLLTQWVPERREWPRLSIVGGHVTRFFTSMRARVRWPRRNKGSHREPRA